MKQSYGTKEAATLAAQALNCGECFTAVYIGAAYAQIDGVEGNKWYVFNNVSKSLV